jgi:tRNA (cmo5U34)-methyltransferase
MKIRDIFDACAQVYDQDRPSLIPCFDLFYGTLLRQIPFPTDAPIRVLDVGAGTGLVSSFVGQQFPNATFVLTDIAEKMLAMAKERFQASNRHDFQIRDSRELPFRDEFDVVVSALSIHHLPDKEKQIVYANIHRALKPGGVFLHAEQVLGPTPELEAFYQKTWLDGIWSSGLAADRVEASIKRCLEDLNAPLDDNLKWLREVGFKDVDCWFKYYRFAVFGGRK